jgi:CTP:phosphocholine cytidylyltransferase-like protein
MPILNRGKSKYINSLIDNKEYCLTNGKFSLSLAKQNLTLHDYVVKYEQIAPKCIYCDNTTKLKSNDGINWIFHEVCGSKECTSKAYS